MMSRQGLKFPMPTQEEWDEFWEWKRKEDDKRIVSAKQFTQLQPLPPPPEPE